MAGARTPGKFNRSNGRDDFGKMTLEKQRFDPHRLK